MLRIKSTIGLVVLIALAGPAAISQPKTPPKASVVCLSKIDVGDGPDPYGSIYRVTSEGQLACPFVGREAQVISPLAQGTCADLKFERIRSQSKAMPESEMAQAVSCLANMAPTRRNGVAGTVQAVEVQRPKSGAPDPVHGQITLALLRTGLPVSAFESAGSGFTVEAGWKDVYCFEMMDRAPPLNVKSELARFGVSWPEGARLAAGDWTNCAMAFKALVGSEISRDPPPGLDH